MSTLTTFHTDIKNILEQGICYTLCSKWDMEPCEATNLGASDHFRGVTKMVAARREKLIQ